MTDRFQTPLYSVAEAAQYLGVPGSTFRDWAKGYTRQPTGRPVIHGEPVVTVIEGQPLRWPSVPFVGLAEGLVLAGIRATGVPMQRIRPALNQLKKELGLVHVLASKALYTDGAEILYDYSEQSSDSEEAAGARELVVVRDGQHVFNDVIDRYLKRVTFAGDGYVEVIKLPGYHRADVVADPRHGFGQPTFTQGGAKVEDALNLFLAGESLTGVAAEFGVPLEQLSKTPYVSHPGTPPEPPAGGLPFVFVDRSLGRIQVPNLLRAAGIELVTLAGHYGIPQDEKVQDTTWIAESAERGWIAFMKDVEIRRNRAERKAILDYGARCFCLTNANLLAAEGAARFIRNLPAIERACTESGPFLYSVQANRLERIRLDDV